MTASDGAGLVEWEDFLALPLSDPNEPEGPFFVTEVQLTCGSEEYDDADLYYEIHVGLGQDEKPVELLFVPAIVYFPVENAALKVAVSDLGYHPQECKDGERIGVDLSQSMATLELRVEADPYAADRGALSTIAPSALKILPIGEYQYEHEFETRRIPNCTLIHLASEHRVPLDQGGMDIGEVGTSYGISIEFRSWGIKWLDFRPHETTVSDSPAEDKISAIEVAGGEATDDARVYSTARAGGIHLAVKVEPKGFVAPLTPIALRCAPSRRDAGSSLNLVSTGFGPVSHTALGCYTFEFGDPEVIDEFAGLTVPEMIDILKSTRDPVVAAQVAVQFAERRDQDSAVALRACIGDLAEDSQVVCNAIWALHERGELAVDDVRGLLEQRTDTGPVEQAAKAALLVSRDSHVWLSKIDNETVKEAMSAFLE